MYDHLSGLTVVEASSFVAGPSCGLHLQQMGAQVIRIDPLRGGPDFHRWPLAGTGRSLFWEGMNKGKLSICLDLASEEGRELAQALVTAPGEGRGLFVTNFPARGFLSHEGLSARREDLITVRIQGWADGRNGVDYTVNAAVGVPFLNGPEDLDASMPVNSVIPVWDLLAGSMAAYNLLAAEQRRRRTGEGGEALIALSDIAAGTLSQLGMVPEMLEWGDRPRYGNALYGAFGRDFPTADARRIMIVALTQRQWSGLLVALEIEQDVRALETELSVTFADDAGVRFIHRDRLFALVEAATTRQSYAELTDKLERAKVCWEPFRTVAEAVTEDRRFVAGNPVFAEMQHPSGLRYPTPGPAMRAQGRPRGRPSVAPLLGQDAEQVLSEGLGLSSAEIGRLRARGVVGLPEVGPD